MNLDFTSPEFWVAAVQIITVNLLLSGDNAVVIALACRSLPQAERKRAVFWGVFGAVGARVVLTLFAATLLALPWLKIAGGGLLLWIGVQLVAQEEDVSHEIHAGERLAAAIRTVVMADVVMSLDNVVAVAAAAKGNLPLLVMGLALSIPIVVLGSSLVMTLIRRFPWLVIAGGGLLGWIGGDLAVGDVATAKLMSAQPWIGQAAPYAGLVLVVAAGLLVSRAKSRQDAAP